jgi:hypothetical protein
VTEYEMRLHCLRLAVPYAAGPASVLAIAQRFWDFVDNGYTSDWEEDLSAEMADETGLPS